MKIVVDTDIIIDVLRGVKSTKEKLKNLTRENELLISGITESEIFAGRDIEIENKKERILGFLSKFEKINPNNYILQKAGEFKRKYKISLLDSIIAATAYQLGASIFTRNLEDFDKVKEINLVDLI